MSDKMDAILAAMSHEPVPDVHDLDGLLEIRVVCADKHWHPDCDERPFVVAVFAQPGEDGTRRRWRLKDELQEGARKESYRLMSGDETRVNVAVPVSDRRLRSTQTDTGVQLLCPKHPYVVPLRWSTIEPVLDTLLQAGVLLVSLQALAARVRK